ncbi:MAG: hypothetical protein O3C21_16190, partial [Verrucomicrobia bacterium]|nr:hypothetical protein [Verrucomicrobiota bacterium]
MPSSLPLVAQAVTSPFWSGWETMAPTSKILLVVLFFILGLALSYLYRSWCVRQHLRLLRKQDELKREWDALNAGHLEHFGQPSAGSDASAPTEFTYEDDDASPATEIETMPAPTVTQPLAAPTTDAKPDQLIVDEPISLSTAALSRLESTEADTLRVPIVATPLPDPTIVIGAVNRAAATGDIAPLLPATSIEIPEKMPLTTRAEEAVDDGVVTAHEAEESVLKPLGAVAAATVATIGPVQEKEDDETETTQIRETTIADAIVTDELPVASPAIKNTETAPLGKDSATTENESSVNVPQPAPAPLKAKLFSNNTPASERTTPLIVNVPPNADPLHLLTGLNPAAANALITLGITRFEQLFSMSDIELAQLSGKHSSLEPLRWREVRDEVRIDARMRSNPLIPPSAATREKESTPKAPPAPASIVAIVVQDEVTQPTSSSCSPGDALTALNGIDALAARQLNEVGIRSYEQIAKLKPSEFDDLARRFMGLKKFAWPFWQNKLTAQAASLAGITVADTSEERSSGTLVTSAIDTTPAASPIREKIEHVREKIAETKDKVENIAREAKHVVSSGASQVKASLEDAKAFAARYSKEGGSIAAKAGHAISGTAAQVADLIRGEFKGEEVVADLQLGVLYKKAPDQPDDLTQIEGINSHAAKALNNAGIFTFQQIAHFSDTAPIALEGRSPALANIDWKAATASAHE